MNRQDLFDALTRQWSDVIAARRDALRWLGRFLLALVVFQIAPWRISRDAAASKLVKGCKLPGQKCSGRGDCCTKKCGGDHRCGCIKKGGKPLVKSPLGPVPVKALCCSNKLNKIKETCK